MRPTVAKILADQVRLEVSGIDRIYIGRRPYRRLLEAERSWPMATAPLHVAPAIR